MKIRIVGYDHIGCAKDDTVTAYIYYVHHDAHEGIATGYGWVDPECCPLEDIFVGGLYEARRDWSTDSKGMTFSQLIPIEANDERMLGFTSLLELLV